MEQLAQIKRVQEFYFPRLCDYCHMVLCDWEEGHVIILNEEFFFEYYCSHLCCLGVDVE